MKPEAETDFRQRKPAPIVIDDSNLEGDEASCTETKFVYSNTKSLNLFTDKHAIRKLCSRISISVPYQAFIILLCVTYFILQACYLPLDLHTSSLNETAAWSSLGFAAALTLDLIFKVIAEGLLLKDDQTLIELIKTRPKQSVSGIRRSPSSTRSVDLTEPKEVLPCLQNPWNIFQAVIIIIAWVSFIPGVLYSIPVAFRCIRLILLLHVIYALPAFKNAVEPIIKSLPQLSSLLFVSILLLAAWSTAGLHLYQDAMHNNCFYSTTLPDGTVQLAPFGNTTGSTPSSNDPASGPGGQLCTKSDLHWKGYTCPSPALGPQCPYPEGCNQTCAAFIDGKPAGGSPEWGQLNFDNFGRGMVFAYAMYTAIYFAVPTGYMMESTGGWAYFFSLSLVLVGFLVCYNLVTIILIDAFEELDEPRRKRESEMKLDHLPTTIARMIIGDDTVEARAHLGSIEKLCEESKKKAAKVLTGLSSIGKHVDADSRPVKAIKALHRFCKMFTVKDDNNTLRTPISELPTALQDYEEYKVLGHSHTWILYAGFQTFVMLCVLGNTIALACQYYGMSAAYEERINTASLVFVWCFVAEAVIKIIGQGKAYWTSAFNWFDLFVTAASVASIYVSSTSGLAALRSIRAIRVLRLFTVLKVLQEFLKLFADTIINSLAYVSLLMYGISCFAILGMHLFGDVWHYGSSGYITPTPFSSFAFSYSIVSNNIHGTYDDTAFYAMYQTSSWAALFYFFELVIGAVLLLNLVIAIIYSRFIQNKNTSEREKALLSSRDKKRKNKSVRRRSESEDAAIDLLDDTDMDFDLKEIMRIESIAKFLKWSHLQIKERNENSAMLIVVALNTAAILVQTPANSDNMELTIWCIYVACACVYVLYLVYKLHSDKWSYFEKTFNRLDFIVILCSVAGCIVGRTSNLYVLSSFVPLMLLSRWKRVRVLSATLLSTLGALYNVALIGFLVMLAYAVIGVEIFMGKFWRCSSNQCCVESNGTQCQNVTVEAECTGYTPSSLPAMPQPCVWSNRYFGFDNVWQGFTTLLILLSGEALNEVWEAVYFSRGDKQQPWYYDNPEATEEYPARQWANELYIISFLIVGFVFMASLFTSWIFDRYRELMNRHGLYATLADEQLEYVRMQRFFLRFWPRPLLPRPDNPVRLFIYTFVCPKDARYTETVEKLGLDITLLRRSFSYLKNFPQNFHKDFLSTDDRHYRRAYLFKTVVALSIACQFVALSLQHYGQSEDWDNGIRLACLVCTGILCLESVFKVVGLGPAYFRQSQFWFQILVSWGALPGCLNLDVSDSVQKIMIIPRLLAVVRLAKYIRGSNAIKDALLVSLVNLSNALLLILIIVICFASVGSNLFYNVYPLPGRAQAMTVFFNWQSVYNALMMLLVSVTGDSWSAFLADTGLQPPNCSNPYCMANNGANITALFNVTSKEDCLETSGYEWYHYKCGDPTAAALFFVPFIILVFIILLNVLVAIVLEAFYVCRLGKELDESFKHYEKLWQVFDQQGKGIMSVEHFSQFMLQLKDPLGGPLMDKWQKGKEYIMDPNERALEFAKDLDNQHSLLSTSGEDTVDNAGDGNIDFHEGLQKLTAMHLGINWDALPDDTKNELHRRVGERKKRALKKMSTIGHHHDECSSSKDKTLTEDSEVESNKYKRDHQTE